MTAKNDMNQYWEGEVKYFLVLAVILRSNLQLKILPNSKHFPGVTSPSPGLVLVLDNTTIELQTIHRLLQSRKRPLLGPSAFTLKTLCWTGVDPIVSRHEIGMLT